MPLSVFVARGVGGGPTLTRLRADHRLRVVGSPRHADLLVVAGAVPAADAGALQAVHDQVPAPRGVAALGVSDDLGRLGLGRVPVVAHEDPLVGLREVHEAVIAGPEAREVLGPVASPVAWQGVGPHGQGGEGMMGGTPYGRPMAMPPVEGRDGLALDRLRLRLGPFLPGLPAGLTLVAGLQGDVLEDVELELAGAQGELIGTPAAVPEVPGGAGTRDRLGAVAELCALAGLGALARRAARVALAPSPAGVAGLHRRLDRPWGLRAATDGVGVLPHDGVGVLPHDGVGVLPHDGVGVLPHDGLDVTGRWRRWLKEAADAVVGGAAPASPLPAPDGRALEGVGSALAGHELGQALLTVASLGWHHPGRPVPAGEEERT